MWLNVAKRCLFLLSFRGNLYRVMDIIYLVVSDDLPEDLSCLNNSVEGTCIFSKRNNQIIAYTDGNMMREIILFYGVLCWYILASVIMQNLQGACQRRIVSDYKFSQYSGSDKPS